MQTPEYLNLNGKLVAWDEGVCHLWTDVAQRGLNVFDAIRGYFSASENTYRLIGLDEHLERLLRSAQTINIPVSVTAESLKQDIFGLIQALKYRGHIYIRPTIFVQKGGYAINEEKVQSGYYIVIVPVSTSLYAPRPVRAAASSWAKIPQNCFPWHVKCGAIYSLTRLSRLEAQRQGVDEAFVYNACGHLAETPGANIFIVRHGIVQTPRFEDGALPGITKAVLTELMRNEMHLDVVEMSLTDDAVREADEVFLSGTLDEICAVTQYNGAKIGTGTIGTITNEVVKRYEQLCLGATTKSLWNTHVPLNS